MNNDKTYLTATTALVLSDETELTFLEESIIMYEDLLMDQGDDADTFVERNSKLDTASVIYDNFYKRVFVDILSERLFPVVDAANILA